jgi:hypothetical protein
VIPALTQLLFILLVTLFFQKVVGALSFIKKKRDYSLQQLKPDKSGQATTAHKYNAKEPNRCGFGWESFSAKPL